jgi:phenylalanine-4-hydroxylase
MPGKFSCSGFHFRENGVIKIFGAGLISSADEMENVLAGKVPHNMIKVTYAAVKP